jgi:hypothetical protein
MKFILIIFSIAVSPIVHAQSIQSEGQFNKAAINLASSEEKRFQKEVSNGTWKVFPEYYEGFLNQKKYDPLVEYINKNFIFNVKFAANPKPNQAFVKLLSGKSYHFTLYLLHKTVKRCWDNIGEYSEFRDCTLVVSMINWVLRKARIKKSNRFLAGLSGVTDGIMAKRARNRSYGLPQDYETFMDIFLRANAVLPRMSGGLQKEGYFKNLPLKLVQKAQITLDMMNQSMLGSKGGKNVLELAKKTQHSLNKMNYSSRAPKYAAIKSRKKIDKVLKVGDIVCFPGFLLGSDSIDRAQGMRKDMDAENIIEVNNGNLGKVLAPYSFDSILNREILFGPFQAFKVTKIKDGKRVRTRIFGNLLAEKWKEVTVVQVKSRSSKCKSMTSGKVFKIP